MNQNSAEQSHPELQLTEGGPTYRLELLLGLSTRNGDGALKRALLSTLLTWVPLCLLAAVEHNAIGKHVTLPFLHDCAVHARFLLGVPLLLLSEKVLGRQLARTAENFIQCGLIRSSDRDDFDAAIRECLRWRDSAAAEAVLYAFAFVVTIGAFSSTSIHVSTWYAPQLGKSLSLTIAGWWLMIFCIPLLQFLALRWLWRLFLWARFLRRVSSLSLNLMPTHPDLAGGLAFVGESERFFSMVLFAYSTVISGVLANSIFYDRIPLEHFAPTIGVYVAISVAIVISPLFTFVPGLWATKHAGKYAYGALALRYTSAFQEKWIFGNRPSEELLLGTADIQSLADLANSFDIIERMRLIPLGPRTSLHLAGACLVPMIPLLLTMMPFGEIVKMLFKTLV